MGELNTSYIYFSKADQLDNQFRQATLKKHAVACHIKLENFLEQKHALVIILNMFYLNLILNLT